jgi:hypothetical protein
MSCIEVRTSFEGVHYWSDAPEAVSFLRHPHRHIFHVEATLQVGHDDRDVEFFLLKAEIDREIRILYPHWHTMMPTIRRLDSQSCEMVARKIFDYLSTEGYHPLKVLVREDQENAGIYQGE